MITAKGTFEVKMGPLTPHDAAAGAKIARLSIDKQFHGDLEATSQGEMLAAGTEVKESAGYVAIERVTGTLRGRSGSFTLQHNATMNRGVPMLNITVVPDSGAQTLTGLTGSLRISKAGSQHSYEFDYELPGDIYDPV
jgi:hypothetical protein